MDFIKIMLISFFVIFGLITSYIDFKTKKVIVLFNYIYLVISVILIIFFLVFKMPSAEAFFNIKKLFISTLIYAVIITTSFFFLNIGAGDAEYLWVISPTLLFFAKFNIYKLIQIYLSQLWFACIGVILFKIIVKIFYLIKTKNNTQSENSEKFAFVPYLFLGTSVSLLVNII